MVPREESFFIMTKENIYSCKTDFELVLLYRANDETAQKVLINRYTGFSYIIARDLFIQYKTTSSIDISDLVSIGLMSLQVAVMSFDTTRGDIPLYPFWKKIAINNMREYIMECSLFKKNGIKFINPNIESMWETASFSSKDEGFIEGEIIAFLNDPKNKISLRDQKIFLAYISGQNYSEIASSYKVSYAVAKRIVNNLRIRIIKALF